MPDENQSQSQNQPTPPSEEPKLNPVPEANELEQKLAEAEKKRDEYLAGWQRAKADFINYKKDEIGRFSETAKYANEDMIRELVSVLDSFDLGIRAMESQGEVERGVYMIRSQIEDILKRWGLTRIEAEIGKPFDPRTQEAIAEVDPPAGGDQSPGTVMEQIEPGYRLHDKIVRPARVKISKGK